jgi:hypothetical protein
MRSGKAKLPPSDLAVYRNREIEESFFKINGAIFEPQLVSIPTTNSMQPALPVRNN